MKKIIGAVLLAICMFLFLDFLYYNLDSETLNYAMTFRLEIPHLMRLRSVPVPLGFVLITAFSLGMVFLAMLQAIPALFKTIALRAKDRRIRELESELEESKKEESTEELNPSP